VPSGPGFGIGTSEVEHVLATQTLPQVGRARCHHRRGRPAPGVTAKDVILGIIGRIGTSGGVGSASVPGLGLRALSMEGA